MNNDRFLTRVFDKQEKKMLYMGDTFFYLDKEYSYAALDEKSIIAYRWTDSLDHPDDGKVNFIPFGDRFIPMMCWGLPDKNKKLIYDDDIIKLQGYLYRASFRELAFCFESLKEVHNVLVPTPLTRNNSEIIGNRWEQPELMEVKA